MDNLDEPTMDELKAAWQYSRLWVAGITFEHALSAPPVMRALRTVVEIHRKRENTPKQIDLFRSAA